MKVQQGVKRVVGKSPGISASGQDGSGGVSGPGSAPGGKSGKESPVDSPQPSSTLPTV